MWDREVRGVAFGCWSDDCGGAICEEEEGEEEGEEGGRRPSKKWWTSRYTSPQTETSP